MNYERASDRNPLNNPNFNMMEEEVEEDDLPEDMSNHTGGEEEEEENSDIDEKLVYLDEKQQKERK